MSNEQLDFILYYGAWAILVLIFGGVIFSVWRPQFFTSAKRGLVESGRWAFFILFVVVYFVIEGFVRLGRLRNRWLVNEKRYPSFRLEREFFREPEQDICDLHVSERVTEKTILSFESPTSQHDKMTPMVRALFDIKGVVSVWLEPYEITIKKGRVFAWPEILPAIEGVVREHLTVR